MELPPFANGSLHLGHIRNYTMADASARFRRMCGCDVLYTTGFDSFGLPNELAARAEGRHPCEVAERYMREQGEQLRRLGFSYDGRRIMGYHVPEYYRWIQWVFLRLFDAGLAYRREAPVNWCPQCESSLADSLVDSGRCWRCGVPIEVRVLEQWFVREVDFADSMLAGLDNLSGWPETVKRIHVDWIGRREGVAVRFSAPDLGLEFEVFLDEPALLPAAEFVALEPDHPVIQQLLDAGTLNQDGQTRIQELRRRPSGAKSAGQDGVLTAGRTGTSNPNTAARKRNGLRRRDGRGAFSSRVAISARFMLSSLAFSHPAALPPLRVRAARRRPCSAGRPANLAAKRSSPENRANAPAFAALW
jgi:leucyl-tRNA synthetase